MRKSNKLELHASQLIKPISSDILKAHLDIRPNKQLAHMILHK
jgi:hypothetical protein